MADGEGPASPPLPKRGAYNFEDFDETSNPFVSKSKLGSSPPNGSRSAAPLSDDTTDPFKPRARLANSPPGSPKIQKSPNNNMGSDSFDASLGSPAGSDSPRKPASPEDVQPAEVKESAQIMAKKKKVIKKKPVQSKIRISKNLKSDQDHIDDVPSSGLDESASRLTEEVVKDKSLPPKKVLSADFKNDFVNINADINSEIENPDGKKEKMMTNVPDDVPLDAAPEEMASSLEIDRHFMEHDDFEDSPLGNSGSQSKAACSGPTLQPEFDSLKGGHKLKTSEHLTDAAAFSKSDSAIKSPKETSARLSSQAEGRKVNQSCDELSDVNRSLEGNSSKHPAARLLEAAQVDNSLRVLENNKNDSSSEEAHFYDAYEYPPVAATNTKLGQKPSAEMEQGPHHDEGGDNKGTVVQLVQVLRYSQTEWNKMKQELEVNYHSSLLNKEREWSVMLADRDKRITQLEESNRKVKHTNEDMRMIVAEFEKTISQLQAEKEKSKTDSHKAVLNLESERDQAIEDLQSVESAFSDLHRRYEKSKSIIEGFKRNEEQLKQCVEDLQAKLKKSDMKLQSLRSQAEEKLDKANEDIEKMKKATKADMVRLEAALKKAELRISSLEESLHRKEKENQELTAICDELIAKVGS